LDVGGVISATIRNVENVFDGLTVASGGTEIVSAGGSAIVGASIAAHGLVEVFGGGTAIASGTLVNSGALVASSTGGIVEIAGGAASAAVPSRSPTASSMSDPAAPPTSLSWRPAAAG